MCGSVVIIKNRVGWGNLEAAIPLSEDFLDVIVMGRIGGRESVKTTWTQPTEDLASLDDSEVVVIHVRSKRQVDGWNRRWRIRDSRFRAKLNANGMLQDRHSWILSMRKSKSNLPWHSGTVLQALPRQLVYRVPRHIQP